MDGIALPGLCKLEVVGPPPLRPPTIPPSGVFKSEVEVQGINLLRSDGDTTNDAVKFGGHRAPTGASLVWGLTRIDPVLVPALVPAPVRVWAEIDGGQPSNTLGFEVIPGPDHPVILEYHPPVETPPTAAEGDYITIVGANFGTFQGRGTVQFCTNATCSTWVQGNFMFPSECGNDFWTNGRVLVKAPVGFVDGMALRVVTDGGLIDAINDSNGPVLNNLTR